MRRAKWNERLLGGWPVIIIIKRLLFCFFFFSSMFVGARATNTRRSSRKKLFFTDNLIRDSFIAVLVLFSTREPCQWVELNMKKYAIRHPVQMHFVYDIFPIHFVCLMSAKWIIRQFNSRNWRILQMDKPWHVINMIARAAPSANVSNTNDAVSRCWHEVIFRLVVVHMFSINFFYYFFYDYLTDSHIVHLCQIAWRQCWP